MQPPCLKEASQPGPHGCCSCPILGFLEPLKKVDKTRSNLATCRRNFAATTTSSILPNSQFTNPESLPSLGESFAEFSEAYPLYSETYQVDHIRAQEYHHLSVSNRTCLDYIGTGLFSYSQLQKHNSENQIASYSSSSSSSLQQQRSPLQNPPIPFFSVSYKTGILKTQLLHGGQESELESAMKKKIMNFLRISENDYSMVFTANRTSAFKLVAESYPFKSSKKLLTVYDYESEAVEAMINGSEKKGADVMSAEFSWPRLRINSAKLRKMLVGKAKKNKKTGLFVFPVHSRVTGARYPYLWMSIAQENGWHILVDACALGPKDMDSFGLSLIRPDFLICSFYKIFGENPAGFGCLFVKKTTGTQLEYSTSPGMVSLLPEINMSHLQGESLRTGTELEQPLKFVVVEDRSSTSNTFSGPISSQMIHSGRMAQRETSKSEAAGTTGIEVC
uniref:Aminotransferase class V domain-containing protein n=1 Tax=Rhizophora mucronata TaxID=61149 RepID=A0A2P2IJ20_RHIMU